MPPTRAAAATRSPLSGPMRTSPRPVAMAIGRRAVPTPGSTTATWNPTGRYGSAHHRRSAPSRIANFRTSWLMSTIRASGRDPEDDAAHDRCARVARAEVGQERDQRTGHGRDRTARNIEAAPGGGQAPLRKGVSRWREEDRRRDGGFSCRAGRRAGPSVREGVGRLGELAGPVHGSQEEQLVDLAERPATSPMEIPARNAVRLAASSGARPRMRRLR